MKKLLLLSLIVSTSVFADPPAAINNLKMAIPTGTPGVVVYDAGTDSLVPATLSGLTITGSNPVTLSATTGGGGNVSNTGTPTAGQMAQWTSSTVIKGVTLSGAGTMTASIDTSGVLSLSSIPNSSLSNSAISIAGSSTSLGGTISRDTITGVSSNGIIQRTGANAYGAATAKTDYWDTTDFTHSGTGHAHGLVPDPGATTGTTKFLREDATWVVPPTGGGSGTVTNTGGNLTANAVVLGAGTVDTKVVTGIVTNGTDKITLGGGSTAASLGVYNAGNQLTNIIGGTTLTGAPITITLPSAATTLVGIDTTDLLTNKTLRGAQLGDSTTQGFTMRNAGNQVTTVLPTSSGTPTITLPSATTTLVGTGTTDALTNKTFDNTSKVDSSGLVFNSTGNAGITLKRGGSSGSTFTVTLPEATTTLVGTNSLPTGAVVGTTDTQTLTNKRINPRVDSSTSASSATWAPNSDTTDIFELAGTLTVAVTTISNPSGTPVDGQKLMIRVKADATPHALTWSGSQWRNSSDLTLPGTTIASKTMYLGFSYNSTDTKWDLIAYLNNF